MLAQATGIPPCPPPAPPPAARQEKRLEDALWMLNAAAAGEQQWDAIREGVAALYADAGQRDVANFIMHGH